MRTPRWRFSCARTILRSSSRSTGTRRSSGWAQGRRPSLILLDVMMPGTDGHAFRAAQRADPALAAIPVIVVSGAYDLGSIAEQLGIRTFLTKPVDAQRLLDPCGASASRRRSRSPSSTCTLTTVSPSTMNQIVTSRPGGTTTHLRSARSEDVVPQQHPEQDQ